MKTQISRNPENGTESPENWNAAFSMGIASTPKQAVHTSPASHHPQDKGNN